MSNKINGIGSIPPTSLWWQFWQWKHCYLRNMHHCIKGFLSWDQNKCFCGFKYTKRNLKKTWSKLVNWCQNDRGWYICLLTVTDWLLQPSEFLIASLHLIYNIQCIFVLVVRYCLLSSFGTLASYLDRDNFFLQSDVKGGSIPFPFKSWGFSESETEL